MPFLPLRTVEVWKFGSSAFKYLYNKRVQNEAEAQD